MNRYPLWRYCLLAALILLGVIYALPNLYGEDPALQVSNKTGDPVSVAVISAATDALQAHHVRYQRIETDKNAALIRFYDADAQLKAQDVVQAVVGSDYSVALNLAPRTPAWLVAMGAHPMKLGLDLRGGIHFLMDVDVAALIKANQTGDLHAMALALRRDAVRYDAISTRSDGAVMIRTSSPTAAAAAMSTLQSGFSTYTFSAVPKGSSLIVGQLSQPALVALQDYAVDQNLNILRSRVNELGVAEPVIARQGATQISVDLPGIQDTARAKEMIGKVATLSWQLVDTEHDAAVAAKTGHVPFGDKLYEYEGQPVLLKNTAILKGSSITNAGTMIAEDGRPAVSVRVAGSEDSSFNRATAENVGKPLAVVYVETKAAKVLRGDQVITEHHQVESIINIATIQSALGNNFQITGLASNTYAQNLALLLRSGAYSAPVDFVQERVVGPSLGKENIHMGVLSTEVGALLVIVFMAFYYRAFGLIADVALVLNLVFLIAILSILGATLTLPAIAGIVLTVGIAVDANVLINERIREELRNGLSVQASITAGYDRAFATIVDANVSTLIVAVVLLALGTGSVQGFAVTLIIGILCSMVTAIFFTRAVVNVVYGGNKAIKKLSIGMRAG